MNLNDDAKALAELERAVASGNPEMIARTAMFHAWPLYTMHSERLRRAVESLPSRVLERYPVLRAVHPMTAVLARTSRPFKPLIDPDQARAMSPDELDALTMVQMIAFRLSGDVAAALIYARRLEDRLRHVRVESRERTDGPLWYFHYQIGTTLFAAGDSARALLEFATARQLGRMSKQPYAERMALGRTALAHAMRGSLEQAAAALTELEGHPPVGEAHRASAQSTEHTARALIAVERMSPDAEDLIATLQPYDSVEVTWPFALLARTRALLALQRPADALEAVRLADESHPPQHGAFASDVILSSSIHALAGTGDSRGAWRLIDEAPRRGRLTRLAAVRLALHECRLDFAAQELTRLASEPALGPGTQAEAALLRAWLDVARTGELDNRNAIRIGHHAMNGNSRRALAMVPRQLIDQVRVHLAADVRDRFDAVTAGLPFFELAARPTLTPGELRVLNALPSAPTTAAIAATFHVSPNTVKTQLKALYRKLGCSTREDAIRIAVQHHLLTSDPGEPYAPAAGEVGGRLDARAH